MAIFSYSEQAHTMQHYYILRFLLDRHVQHMSPELTQSLPPFAESVRSASVCGCSIFLRCYRSAWRVLRNPTAVTDGVSMRLWTNR